MSESKKQLAEELFLELRKRLIRVVLFMVFGFGIGVLYYKQVVRIVLGMYDLRGINIVMTHSYQVFDLVFWVGIAMAIVFAFPISLFELYRFFRPALRGKERILIKRVIPMAIVLFVVGFALGVRMTQFIFSISSQASLDLGLGNILDISRAVGQIISMGLLTGLVFEIPIIFSVIIQFGLITRKELASKRKIVYAVLLILAVIGPSTDALSLVLIFLPLVFLFELALLLNRDKL